MKKPEMAAISSVVSDLQSRFGERVAVSGAVRTQHGHTLTFLPTQAPDAVVFVRSVEEVQTVVRLCAASHVPVIAFGAGSSLEGHVNAPLGGICLDFREMAEVFAIHQEDLDCVVQPGITRQHLNAALRDQGLFFPIDPGAEASLGGMVATRASGTNAVRYGTMKDAVLGLQVVLPSGEAIRVGSRAKKSSAGYDLTRLFVGSEGTLGIITEITLRLSGLPEAVQGGVCAFPSVEAACETVILTIQCGLPVARIELLDEVMIRGCNLYSKLTLPESPHLFVEFHGTDQSVAESAARFAELAADMGGGAFVSSSSPEARTRLWQARHDAYWAVSALRPGSKVVSTDVCVPISRLAECVRETKADLEASNIIGPIVGHVGDGNFHVLIPTLMDDAADVARIKPFMSRLVDRALAMDGTCTGEHGIGQGKMEYLVKEVGEGVLDVMRGIKRAVDPESVFNPGKIFKI